RLILLGESHLRTAVREFTAHYHEERNHQGLGNELIVPLQQPANTNAPVECRERLGGILRFYYRLAA
ncbi:MAG: hypothetical protein V2A73_13210, partial [Pseudomonadota bacterium]